MNLGVRQVHVPRHRNARLAGVGHTAESHTQIAYPCQLCNVIVVGGREPPSRSINLEDLRQGNEASEDRFSRIMGPSSTLVAPCTVSN